MKKSIIVTTSLVAIAGVAGSALYFQPAKSTQPKGLQYSRSGYGAYDTAKPQTSQTKVAERNASSLNQARDEYNQGDFLEAELSANKSIANLMALQTSVASMPVKKRQELSEAQSILAYSAARRNDLKLAQKRFSDTAKTAAFLPDGGHTGLTNNGGREVTLSEDAAYQHAVCTAALGDKKGAEHEYIAFMKQYPSSPLVNAAYRRIEKLNDDGKCPVEAEKAWKDATHIAARTEALCGPECLAHLLGKQQNQRAVMKLAGELGTNGTGTTLASLVTVSKRHGMQCDGVKLTWSGLQQQTAPLIALTNPSHYVVLKAIAKDKVTVWDPDANGIGKGAAKPVNKSEWLRMWTGVAIRYKSPS